jgi:succinoglycan biosynthesis protein ExoA
VPTDPFETAVAAATTSWLGTGGATYRTGGVAGPVDTVYLGVFERAAVEHVGHFDERLVRNQDYELNIRLRAAGRAVWFDPELWVGYRPRGSWAALARQYFEYGRWKAEVLRMHPRSLRARQLAPPLAVLATAAAVVAARRQPVLAVVPAAYVAALTTTAARSPRVGGPGGRARTAAALAVIHWTWTAGLLTGAVLPGRNRRAS